MVNKIIFSLTILTLSFCNTKDDNKVKLTSPEITAILNTSQSNGQFLFLVREIDTDLTTNCGVASPGSVASTTPGQGGTTPAPDPNTGGSANSRFTILSQLRIKDTGETLTMRFLYDSAQTQGALDQQQGFALTGGVFNKTISGKLGNVKWQGQGAGYLDESGQARGNQNLSFLNVTVNFTGFFSGDNTNTSTPLECFTSDGINCTTVTTTSKCFTQDNSKCLVSSNAGTSYRITGEIKCTAKNLIP
jgi:hypothetical protein